MNRFVSYNTSSLGAEPTYSATATSKFWRSLALGSGLIAATTLNALPSIAQTTVIARRPSAPYRAWYGISNPASYPNITMVTSGDARYLETLGKTGLDWVYGPQYPYASDSNYWIQRCDVSNRTKAANSTYPYNFVTAGIGVDEWSNAHSPGEWAWVRDGLKTGKTSNPEVFIAMWTSNTVHQELYDMGFDNTADVYLVEGYTHTRSSGTGIGFGQALARMEELKQRGLGRKTVFCFGHMSDLPDLFDKSWSEAELRACIEDIRAKYPESPGIAFFNGDVGDQTAYNNLQQLCNDLAAEYWPDSAPLSGTYSLTPQSNTASRLDANNSGTTNSTAVLLYRSKYPQSANNQKWRFKSVGNNLYEIFPAYSSTLRLTVKNASTSAGAQVYLYNSTTSNSRWKLTKVTGGYKVSPSHATTKYLTLNSTSNGTLATIENSSSAAGQIWAITPEFCNLDPVPPYYQAENATLNGGSAIANGDPFYTGSGYVNLPTTGGGVTFNNVDGGAGGNQILSFRYALGAAARTVNLTVNGVTSSITFPPSLSPTTVSTPSYKYGEFYNVSKNLNAGTNNTITITTTGQDGPHLDKLTILPGTGTGSLNFISAQSS